MSSGTVPLVGLSPQRLDDGCEGYTSVGEIGNPGIMSKERRANVAASSNQCRTVSK